MNQRAANFNVHFKGGLAFRLRSASASKGTNAVFKLFAAILLLGLPPPVCGQYAYITNADSTLTITRYNGTMANVVVPSQIEGMLVTALGEGAFDPFMGSSFVSSVIIPDSVTSLGEYLFGENYTLTNIVIGNGVTNIAGVLYDDCPRLAAITVQPSNTAYSSQQGVLFDKLKTELVQCPSGITGEITIPPSVTNIGAGAFWDCWDLTNLDLPNGVTVIGPFAFEYCGLSSISIPNGVGYIDNSTFNDAAVTNVTLPSSVTNIAQQAFFDCGNLASVTIPGHVTTIGDYAFFNCTNLKELTIPDSVSAIGAAAFKDCAGLGTVSIPNAVAIIGSEAFEFCSAMTNLTIGSGVTNIGSGAFDQCINLAVVFVNGNAPQADGTIFGGDPGTAYYLQGMTGWAAFSSITGIPVVLWNPQIQTQGYNFGLAGNAFGFTITGTSGIPVELEFCADLAYSNWVSLKRFSLTNGFYYFSESPQTNSPNRFYRLARP